MARRESRRWRGPARGASTASGADGRAHAIELHGARAVVDLAALRDGVRRGAVELDLARRPGLAFVGEHQHAIGGEARAFGRSVRVAHDDDVSFDPDPVAAL